MKVFFILFICFLPLAFAQESEKGFSVILFYHPSCPISKGLTPKFEELVSEFSTKYGSRIKFDKVRTPLYEEDQDQKDLYPTSNLNLIRKLGVIKVPTFVVREGALVRYHGPLFERGSGSQVNLVRNALEALLDGRPVLVAKTKAIGCATAGWVFSQ